MTDLLVKSTNKHQFLDPNSSQPYHYKKGIPYSQALRLNKICSNNEDFNKRCNDLKRSLMEREYNGKKIKKQILWAREYFRKEKTQTLSKLTFNINYYRVFENIRKILQELHLLLPPDKKHKKVFANVPVV